MWFNPTHNDHTRTCARTHARAHARTLGRLRGRRRLAALRLHHRLPRRLRAGGCELLPPVAGADFSGDPYITVKKGAFRGPKAANKTSDFQDTIR